MDGKQNPAYNTQRGGKNIPHVCGISQTSHDDATAAKFDSRNSRRSTCYK